MNKLPKARTAEIVVQHLHGEVLIYDLKTNKAFCLNETSAQVFNHCDGQTTFAELKEKRRLTGEIIYLALDELKKNDLLAADYTSPFAGMSRREVIRRIGFASMIALPMISGIVAPPAANAASGSCTPGYDFSDRPNGYNGKGDGCYCSIAANPTQARCNTTRGGDPDPAGGCKSGCICYFSGSPVNCGDAMGNTCPGRCG